MVKFKNIKIGNVLEYKNSRNSKKTIFIVLNKKRYRTRRYELFWFVLASEGRVRHGWKIFSEFNSYKKLG